jgi:hypothetical protein
MGTTTFKPTSPPVLEHINVKIFARQVGGARDFDLARVVPVFHRWIQSRADSFLPIDVADYRHVPDGPGVMLIGHHANVSLDLREGRLGLLYNQKTVTGNSPEDQITQAYEGALSLCERLEQEPELRDCLSFNRDTVEIFINDRLLTPNTEETHLRLLPLIEAAFQRIFPGAAFTVSRQGEPRERYRVLATKVTS